ncbi:MAG TPA: PucR family transcriptional regulator, partial [Marmoricola sp.]
MSTSRSTRPRGRARVAQRLQRSAGALSSAALARMETDLPWIADLDAQDRSTIGLVLQSGIAGFVEWYRDPGEIPVRAEVFGAAPTAFAGVVSLEQTVALVRLSIEVVEQNIVDIVSAEDLPEIRSAIDSYAREIAFATAEVYARAAEQRGAWDARLETLLVDSVLRAPAERSDDELSSRASALGWSAEGYVTTVVGRIDDGDDLGPVRHFAREKGLDCLCAVQGHRLVVILGGVRDDGTPAPDIATTFADGPVVIGPVVPGLAEAGHSANAAFAGLRVIGSWPGAPRPVRADELLPERALDGDADARTDLVERVYGHLDEDPVVLETVCTYLEHGSSMEA